ncbi:hypothetical protein DWY02_12080 [Eubacterium sp. AF22-9]|nr:DUF5711 family protein [Eubacterium sp. AF22-9]RGS28471.1 hypothetical protein DWY02_12080 [Eubacterium sp. AF22-9]
MFYNFSDVGKNETERVVGGFNYDDVIVGDVKFIDDTQAVAVGENVVSIYKIKEYPSLEHTIEINNEIEKIFYSDKYIGMILDNSDSGDPYNWWFIICLAKKFLTPHLQYSIQISNSMAKVW